MSVIYSFCKQTNKVRSPSSPNITQKIPQISFSCKGRKPRSKKTKGATENQQNAWLCIAESRKSGFLDEKSSMHTPSGHREEGHQQVNARHCQRIARCREHNQANSEGGTLRFQSYAKRRRLFMSEGTKENRSRKVKKLQPGGKRWFLLNRILDNDHIFHVFFICKKIKCF